MEKRTLEQVLRPFSKDTNSKIYSILYSEDFQDSHQDQKSENQGGDQEIQNTIRQWSTHLGSQPLTALFSKKWWYGHLMHWCLKRSYFKTRLFHFVDVFPTLHSRREMVKHLKEYFEIKKKGQGIFNLSLKGLFFLASFFLNSVRRNIIQMANLFIAGRDLEDSWPKILKILKSKRAFTTDLLGELTLSEKEAFRYQKHYLDLLDQLSLKVGEREKKLNGTDFYRDQPNISIKLTSLFSQINEVAWDETVETLVLRLEPILKKATQKKCFINLDMEKYRYKDLSFCVFKRLIMSPWLKDYPFLGIVLQAYLKDSAEDVKTLVEWAKIRKTPFTIRLVKGAYWDFEVNHALDLGWSVPVYEKKNETDANFERLAWYLFKNKEFVRVAIASHNMRSLSAACFFAKKASLKKSEFEIQMLYGMADQLKEILVREGYFVREYVPLGEMVPGMSYLVRRLLENTSNESFLRLRYENKDLLKGLLSQNPLVNS